MTKTSSQKIDVFEDARESIDFLAEDVPEYAFVLEHIKGDLERRRAEGVDTYGESLVTNNGRDALVDLYEELLDAYVYSRQACLEGRDSPDEGDLEEVSAAILDDTLIPLARVLSRRYGRRGFLRDKSVTLHLDGARVYLNSLGGNE